jgi:hypothetical protein
MKAINFSKGFLAIGKTQESREAGEGGFKRYVGLGSTFVKAVQPTKAEIDEFFGYESQAEPEYVKDGENGKEAHITFLLQTDSKVHEGIDIKNRITFVLRNAPDYNKDQTRVRVIDGYGNYTWANVEDAKAGKALVNADGNPKMIDTKYRMACVGECDLVSFLKKYLWVQSAFNYVDGVWVKKEDADSYKFALENIKDYFKGDFKELKGALNLQPNNKIKLLYGVRTTDEGKQYQSICTKGELMLPNAANIKAINKLEKDLVNAKQSGMFSNIDYRVCELQEWDVKPTNLEEATSNDPLSGSEDNDMWNF